MLAISQGPIGGIAVLLATAVFLGLNFHHDMLRALAISFVELPAGQFGSPLPGIEIYIVLSKVVIVTGIRVAGPVLCLVFLVNAFMMVLTKVAPNMNVFFSVGFIFSMIGGMIRLFYMLPQLFEGHLMAVSEAISNIPQCLNRFEGQMAENDDGQARTHWEAFGGCQKRANCQNQRIVWLGFNWLVWEACCFTSSHFQNGSSFCGQHLCSDSYTEFNDLYWTLIQYIVYTLANVWHFQCYFCGAF